MKKYIAALSLSVILVGCGDRIMQTKPISSGAGGSTDSGSPVSTQPVYNINISIGGDTISAEGGTATGTGGQSTNSNSSGNSQATGGTGGGASAGNSTSNANNSGSSNNSNSGTASNSANNSTSNSSDNHADVSDSGNSSNTNTNQVSAEVDIDLDFDFNVYLEGDEDYFQRVRSAPGNGGQAQCTDKHPGKHMLCHVYDFSNRTQLSTQLAGAPHLGSFYMDTFDVTARDWQQGFPKFPDSLAHLRENYAVRCFTKLRVRQAGVHTFSITSDDGMRILLSGSPVVQDDGLHAPRTASATTNLARGTYDMEVQWFQGPRTQIAAELKWATPSVSTLRYIAPSDMKKAQKICK